MTLKEDLYFEAVEELNKEALWNWRILREDDLKKEYLESLSKEEVIEYILADPICDLGDNYEDYVKEVYNHDYA